MTPAPPNRTRDGEVVLLLHGLLRGPGSMGRLHRHLAAAGYQVRDWTYPSSKYPLAVHADALRTTLDQLERDPSVERIHLVGHSLGGLVARLALAPSSEDAHAAGIGDAAPPTVERRKVGRLVTLATPHQGSPKASRLMPWFGPHVPILGDLVDTEGAPIHTLGYPVGVEVGTISGSRDRTVPLASSRMPGEHGHYLVDSGHSFIMNHPDTLNGVLRFLTTGSFADPAPLAEKPLLPGLVAQ